MRLPYEVAYGPARDSYFPIRVPDPDRSLPIADITEVIKMIYYNIVLGWY